MYNTAVIDTDSICLRHISGLLKENRDINSVTCFQLWSDYLGELKKGNIHIAFIRVDSPGVQGLSLARVTQGVSPATRIVFISSVKSYAVMAFEERASGYLVLPVTQQDLDEVVVNIKKSDQWRRGD
jgi:two-component SAPR family response regulator